jgi:hypothetical protein
MTGLENTLRVMAANAMEMIRSIDEPKGLVEALHWADRDLMRTWEQDELRKMQEEGIRSPFTQWRARNEEVLEEGLNSGQLYEELRRLGHSRHTRLNRDQEQAGGEWEPDEWIRTSVWILEEIGGGHQERVANLRSVGLRIYPSVYTA